MRDKFNELYRRIISENIPKWDMKYYNKENVDSDLVGRIIAKRVLHYNPKTGEYKQEEDAAKIFKIIKYTWKSDPSRCKYQIVWGDKSAMRQPSLQFSHPMIPGKFFDAWVAGLSQKPVFSDDYAPSYDFDGSIGISPIESTLNIAEMGCGFEQLLEQYVFEENLMDWEEYYERMKKVLAEDENLQ